MPNCTDDAEHVDDAEDNTCRDESHSGAPFMDFATSLSTDTATDPLTDPLTDTTATERSAEDVPVPTYGVGIVNYRTYDDVRRCVESIKRQSLAPMSVVLIDADGDTAELANVQREFPSLVCEPRSNDGFAAGANRALAKLHTQASGCDFMLLLNPDVELAPNFAERLLGQLADLPKVALASGKLLRPGEAAIDSAGITLPSNRRPQDRGSEQLDRGQFDKDENVFAASGAVLMLRSRALPDLEIDGEVFDEDFFMYHEDTDLAWRAHSLGWHTRYVHSACAIHTRRWRPYRRFEIDPRIRRHSFKNHYLQIIKNENLGDFLRNLPMVFAWEVVRLGYTVLRDRAMLPSYLQAIRLAPRAFYKRRIIRARMRQRGAPDTTLATLATRSR